MQMHLGERHLGGDEWTDLTVRQEQCLNFIEDCIRDNGFPPTRAEIAKHFGYKSDNAAHILVLALEHKGRIVLTPKVSRGIRIVSP